MIAANVSTIKRVYYKWRTLEELMRVLLLLNGPRERYIGGADTARRIKWREYCSPATELEIGYLPSVVEGSAGAKVHLEPERRCL